MSQLPRWRQVDGRGPETPMWVYPASVEAVLVEKAADGRFRAVVVGVSGARYPLSGLYPDSVQAGQVVESFMRQNP